MKVWKRVVAGGTLIIAGAVAGATVAAAAPGGGSSGQPPAATPRAVPQAAVDSSVETKFTPIAPCRLVDTRVAGGRIGTRAFYAAGTTGFVTQGGHAGGCGIPAGATAIQASIVAPSPLGSGYIQAWAYGAPQPTNSFANYQPGVLVATGGVIPINGAGAKSFFLSAAGPATHAVVDVTGYFIKSMWAEVGAAGTIVRGSRVVSATRLGTGTYQVDFDRDVSNCAYGVTSFFYGLTAAAQPRSGDPTGVYVSFANTANAATDTIFYLTVTC